MDYLNLEEITHNNVTFDIKKNVKTIYTTNDISEYTNTNEKKIIFYDKCIIEDDLKIFFLFETEYHDAFGHWIYENAVFLQYIKYFPKNMYILVKKNEHRTYKTLFFNLFNIEENRICYLDNILYESFDYNLIPENNLCIICRNIRLNTRKSVEKSKSIFTILLNNFYNEIFENNIFDYNKKIKHLIFTRNKKENYKPNDRHIDYSKLYNLLKGEEYITYNTEETVNIKDQIQLLLSAENVYLDSGSSLSVNGLFCKNSNIYAEQLHNINGCFIFSNIAFKDFIMAKNNMISY